MSRALFSVLDHPVPAFLIDFVRRKVYKNDVILRCYGRITDGVQAQHIKGPWSFEGCEGNLFSRRASVAKTAVGKESISPCPPVDLSGEAGWVPFDAPSLVGESLRFVAGEPDGNRFRVRYYRDGKQHLHARIWFGPETE